MPSSPESSRKLCPECGESLPDNAPAGLCPTCLLRVVMAESDSGISDPPRGGTETTVSTAIVENGEYPKAGTTIRYFGDYELHEEIARGGMGVVYRARQVRLNRQVALKMIRAGKFSSDTEVQRLRVEAEAAAQLDHPAIVPVFEVGEYEGLHYFTMAFVEGETLSAKLNTGPLSPHVAAKLMQTVAEAVSYAHERGVIHRDIKPGNILIDKSGQPRVSDFGLAKQVSSDSDLTTTGQILGTPAYMPPEQALGKLQDVGKPSDVYSLGAVLYATLTGRPPFQAATAIETLRLVVEQQPLAPRLLNPSIPRDLETICLKCLEKTISRRYSSAQEAGEELGRFLRGDPILALPASPLRKLVQSYRRHRTTAVISASILLMFAGIAAASVFAWIRELNFRETLEKQQVETREALNRSQDSLSDIHTVGGVNASRSGEHADAAMWFATASTILAPDNEKTQRNLQRSWLESLESPVPMMAIVHPEPWVTDLRFSPSGRYLLTGSPPAAEFTGECRIWDSASGTEIRIPQLTGNLTAADWSPDGEMFAAGSSTGVLIVQDDPEGPVGRMIRLNERIDLVRFDPAGKFVAAVFGARRRTEVDDTNAVYGVRLQVFHAKDLTPATPVLRQPQSITTIGFDIEGKRIAAANSSGTFQVHSVPSDTDQPLSPSLPCWTYGVSVQIGQSPPVPLFINHGREIVVGGEAWDTETWKKSARSFGYRDPNAVTLSPDGTRVLVSHFNGLGVYSVASGRSHIVRSIRDGCHALDADLSPNGKYVLRGGSDSQVELLSYPDLIPVCGAMAHAGTVPAVAWSSDSKRFATSQRGGLVRIWSMPSSAAETVTLPGIGLVAMSNDGKFIASRGTSHRDHGPTFTRVYSTVDGEAAGPLLHVNGKIRNAVFSPDGNRLAVATTSPWTVAIRNWRDAVESTMPQRMLSEPRGIDFSPDGNSVAVLCAGGELVLLDASNAKIRLSWSNEVEHFSALEYVDNGALAFSPDGQRLLTYQTDSSVRVWEVSTGKLLYRTDGHTGRITCLTFSADGRHFATGSRDNTARVWELSTGLEVSKPLVHPDAVLCVCFHPQGQFLATGSFDGEAHIWDWRSGTETGSAMSHSHSVYGVQFFRDGELLTTVSEDGVFQMWDAFFLPIMKPVRTSGRAMDLKISQDQRRAVVGGIDSPLTLISLDRCCDGTAMSPQDCQLKSELISGKRIGNRVSVSVLSANDWLSRWKLFESRQPDSFEETAMIQGQKQFVKHTLSKFGLTNLESRIVTAHSGPVSNVAASPDGRYVVSIGPRSAKPEPHGNKPPESAAGEPLRNDLSLRLTDLESGQEFNRFSGPAQPISSFSISTDGRRVAGVSDDGIVYVWNFEDGQLVRQFKVADRPTVVRITSDGEHVLIGGAAGVIQYWNVGEANRISELNTAVPGSASVLELSPDGSEVAVAHQKRIRRFRLPDLSELEPYAENSANITVLKWSPQGQRLATSADDHSWMLWDSEVRSPLHRFPSHADNQYRSIAWASDGSRLAVGGTDGLIHVYSLTNLEFPELLRQHEGSVNDLAYLPDRKGVVSGGFDQSVRIWPVAEDEATQQSPLTLISKRHQLIPLESEITKVFPAARLDVIGVADGVRLERQPLESFGGHFPIPMHVLVFGGQVGDFVDLAIPVPASGKVRLTLQLTQSYDFGILGFKVNDKPIERLFDSYSFFVAPSPLLDLGEFEVDGTPLRLHTEVTGSNRRSKSPNYYFGIAAVVVEAANVPAADNN
ncbi:MAG: protein kinase [Planctomyces sp.]|nr:protein kinase [Planctomyces sp.]